ncbi:MAG: cytosine methylase [Sulfolobus sp.]|nr:cytosine methylase [Sulfolobus sp.]
MNTVEVSFRDIVNLPSTNYATHNLHPYPATFIPHVVRFVIEKYTSPGDILFDPFAGSGTVAIEASLLGRNAVLWDLNPMLGLLVRASTWKGEVPDIKVDFDYNKMFIPLWSNITYWYPKEFLQVLGRAWGYYHYAVPKEYKPLVAIPLLKVIRKYSYADKAYNFYKSKKAIEQVEMLLKTDYRHGMEEMYKAEYEKMRKKILEYQSLKPKDVKIEVKAGVDSLTQKLDEEVDVLLTSPPYLQAQEYIRATKLELAWLGYTERQIRELSSKEIPYNKPLPIKIRSETYYEYLEKVKKTNHKKLINIYTTYFYSILGFLTNINDKIRRYMTIFVGPAKIRNIRIPIDIIIKEHMEALGWKHEITYIDTIKSRTLFKVEKNPATGMPDERIPTEHLLVLRK